MKESIVQIGNHQYRYAYDPTSRATKYLGPVGDAPEIGEQEFLALLDEGSWVRVKVDIAVESGVTEEDIRALVVDQPKAVQDKVVAQFDHDELEKIYASWIDWQSDAILQDFSEGGSLTHCSKRWWNDVMDDLKAGNDERWSWQSWYEPGQTKEERMKAARKAMNDDVESIDYLEMVDSGSLEWNNFYTRDKGVEFTFRLNDKHAGDRKAMAFLRRYAEDYHKSMFNKEYFLQEMKFKVEDYIEKIE